MNGGPSAFMKYATTASECQATAASPGLEHADSTGQRARFPASEAAGHGDATDATSSARGLDHAAGTRHDGVVARSEGTSWDEARLRVSGAGRGQSRLAEHRDDVALPGPHPGHWRDADWLLCKDGRFRPVEPGTQPLVNGAPGRVGRLRAYGNGLCAPAAQVWCETVMECLP